MCFPCLYVGKTLVKACIATVPGALYLLGFIGLFIVNGYGGKYIYLRYVLEWSFLDTVSSNIWPTDTIWMICAFSITLTCVCSLFIFYVCSIACLGMFNVCTPKPKMDEEVESEKRKIMAREKAIQLLMEEGITITELPSFPRNSGSAKTSTKPTAGTSMLMPEPANARTQRRVVKTSPSRKSSSSSLSTELSALIELDESSNSGMV